jgi:hypothetical protein
LKSELKSDSFDVSIGIKIPFFRVSVTVEPGRSLLTVRYHELFETIHATNCLLMLKNPPAELFFTWRNHVLQMRIPR